MGRTEKGLVVAGVNYRKTALQVRNKFALTTENIRHIYEDTLGIEQGDFFILSTCNRTEIYSITDKPEDLIGIFSRYSHVQENEARNYTFIKTGDDAVKHLFHVASGLDSQILGDYEIIGQLKNAFALSKTNNRVSGYMEKLVNSSLQASRQVRNRTAISDGTTSVSYAVIQLLKQNVADQAAQRICLMGLGKIGTLTLKNLKHYLPQHTVTLINRNEVRAESLAGEFAVDHVPFHSQYDTLKSSDILIVATGADHPIITRGDIDHFSIKLIFDLSVPSNISADVKEIPGITLYDIDNLSQIVNENMNKRKGDLPLANTIIEEHMHEFEEWEKRRELYNPKS